MVSHWTSILCKVIEGRKNRGVHNTNLSGLLCFGVLGKEENVKNCNTGKNLNLGNEFVQ